ncbi:sigma-54 interaction domain-containing protein [Aneurinibacillus thermoaerophilus]|uniref:Sigma 54-interacting transcriptional regulator n=1 Tax=Aneurinibacillus thermoaerophilus TaxID=143495 RepID=A0ABX8Y7X4_ANETH|nr:sigma 54-interacting transcriptional regulator [Aneurinibacillus thermoaerophilus]MED0679975.1 sigma 54-interacting transcriptional regulator [Aneurinibacillus thermoaerophilus]MED0763626.1 sigma 54-interacting transcriptional regulator [Aneurinibacillus thermoaerophilus]QYY41762.1 sigma 54-interacting transcriptional regulator [Aneurinibacillus thermoaerophilus]
MNVKNFIDEGGAIMNLFHEGVVIVDQRGTVLYVNEACSRITGIPKQELIGQYVKDVVSDTNILKVLQSGYPALDIPARAGDSVVISNIVPIYDETQQLLGAVSIFRDLTEILRLNHRLSEAENTIKDLQQKLSLADLADGNDMLIGNSPAMKKIVEISLKAARVDSTIMIEGESGTGKEMLARFIHNHSERAKQPFVAVNCASIPETLLESELFGYEEGAFSGARRGGKQGMFELADGGTLFLDELEDLTPSVQAKLLRVLQFKELIRVGGTKTKKVDVRIIGASNQSLEKLVKEKKFREDLYYRLNVVRVEIPALRERKEDIPLFVHHILKKMRHKLNKTVKKVHPDVIRHLLAYPFPGNVRELENILELAIIMDDNQVLDLADLPEHIASASSDSSPTIQLPTLREMEMSLIKEAVSKCKNKAEAAQMLGISRATLYRKMEAYGIS